MFIETRKKQVKTLLAEGLSITRIASELQVCRQTIYTVINDIANEALVLLDHKTRNLAIMKNILENKVVSAFTSFTITGVFMPFMSSFMMPVSFIPHY